MRTPTCLLCGSGCMAFLLREASDIAIILATLLCMASSLPSNVSEVVKTDETYFIWDLIMVL